MTIYTYSELRARGLGRLGLGELALGLRGHGTVINNITNYHYYYYYNYYYPFYD